MTSADYPAERIGRYVNALRGADTYALVERQEDLARFAEAVIGVANAETDPVYRSGYRTALMHAGKDSRAVADAAPDFFEPGRSYRTTQHADLRFRCLAVGFHPTTSERHAFGWRCVARLGEWLPAHLLASDWDCCAWTDDTDTPAAGKDAAL